MKERGGLDRLRTCIGCRATACKESMLRIAKLGSGEVVVDPDGRGPGRGAYACSRECLEKSAKDGSLARALRTKVSADLCDRLARQAGDHASWAAAKGSKE